jgi:hypothetical protein
MYLHLSNCLDSTAAAAEAVLLLLCFLPFSILHGPIGTSLFVPRLQLHLLPHCGFGAALAAAAFK